MYDGQNFSLPMLHGIISIVLIALSAGILFALFDIKDTSGQIILGSLMVTFPVVTSTFGYMFTAPYYFAALLFGILGVYFSERIKGLPGFLAGVILICCSLGLYQAYFPVAVSSFVILLIAAAAENESFDVCKITKKGFYYLGILISALVIYFLIWELCLTFFGVARSDYKGISGIGESGIYSYVKEIINAYRYFFLNKVPVKMNLYRMAAEVLQRLLVYLCLPFTIYLMHQSFIKKKRFLEGLGCAILFVVLPVCFNLVFVMLASGSGAGVHSLMLYGQTMFYVYYIWLLKNFCRIAGKARVTAAVPMILMAFLVFQNAGFDNACYLRAQLEQQQLISDFTALKSRIMSTEGYQDTMPVALIITGERDASIYTDKAFSEISIMPYNSIYPYKTGRNIKNTLRKWCNFDPKYVNEAPFKEMDEVKEMPDYPDDGSIKIIDGTVVVKW